MRCEDCREAISARLDGEELPDGAPGADADAAVDRHLDGCAECRDFAERAAYVTRLARIRPAEPTPDLLPGILAALDADRADSSSEDEPVRHPEQQGRVPGARRAWALGGVRIALGLLGIGQVGLAVAGILAATAPAAAGPGHGSSLAGATMVHFSHESAAWNFAIGVAFLWAAGAAPRAGSGLVPVIGAFTGLLAVLSVTDLLAGRVDATRLAGHLVVVAGLLLLLLHRRLSHHGDGDRQTGSPADPDLHRLRTGSFEGLPLGRRGRRDDGGLQPAGHRRAA